MIRRSVVAVTALTLIAGPTAAFGDVSGHAVGGTKLVPGVLAGLSRAVLDGPASAGRVMSIGIGLSRPDPGGENALVAAEYNPKSASYHDFLTPSQFDARFGVAASTVAATTRWLRADGLRITSVSAAGDYIMATGTVRALDKRFATSIGRYHDAKDGSFLANATAPSVPISLPVDGILGLDTVQKATPSAMHSTTATRSTRSTKNASTFSGVLTPRNLWKIYNEPKTDEGQGQTIGIFGEGETDSVITQLRLFEHREHFPKIPVKVIHTEGGKNSTYGDNTGSIEWYLDVQASTGMAPKAKQLDLYFAKTLFDKDIAKSFSTWVNDAHGPKQMNASFGECETNPTNPVTGPAAQLPYGTEIGDELEPVAEPMLKMAVAEGRTLFASAGDTGSGCPEVVVPVAGAGNGVAPQPLPIANYPSASAWAVGVGGTVVTTPASNHGKRSSEQAWQDTGGGPSHFILEPTFQKKTSYITSTNAPCATNRDGTVVYPAGSICRGTPDVAALSGNILGNGYFIYIDGQPSSEGGTSLSSPLTMGMWTRLQAAAKQRSGLGFADETFYQQADKGAKTYRRDFTDITATDSKAVAGVSSTNGGYTAAKGYDFVSGLGALNVGHLLIDVDNTKKARYHQTPAAKQGLVRTTVTMLSPKGNAVNPLDVQAGNLPAIDITKVTVTTSKAAKTLTAVFRGPTISATSDPSASGGEDFYAYWRYDSKLYYVVAHTSQSGAATYASGRINKSGYVDSTTSKVTGSFVGHELKMAVPLSAVGNPNRGAHLINPAAITQINAGGVAGITTLLALTADSASYPSIGKASAGDVVCVGHCKTHRG